MLNGERCDILAILPVHTPIKYWFYKSVSLYKELKSTNFTSIRITLTDKENERLKNIRHVIFELEFIN